MESKGFLASMFDLSFSSFVTTRLIKVLYILALLLGVVVTIGSIFTGGPRAFIVSLVGLAVYAIVVRV